MPQCTNMVTFVDTVSGSNDNFVIKVSNCNKPNKFKTQMVQKYNFVQVVQFLKFHDTCD